MQITRHPFPLQGGGRPPGLPIISSAVEYNNIVYVCGMLADPVGDVTAQTRQSLERVDRALKAAGTDKSKLLSAQIWLSDLRDFEAHNLVWNSWVDPDNAPARACVRADLLHGCRVEIMVTAAK